MSLPVRVFSDFCCPYCFIAKGMLDRIQMSCSVSVLWIPHELHPEIPEDGMSIRNWYPDFDVEAFFLTMNRMGEPYGIRFLETDRVFNSGPALRAAEFARDLGAFDAFHHATFEALFTHGRNIAKRSVLEEIAASVGLDPDQMNAALDSGLIESRMRTAGIESADRNIRMTPTFLVPGHGTIEGVPAYARLENLIVNAC